MKFSLIITFISIFIIGCKKTVPTNSNDNIEVSELSFSPTVGASLKNKGATVVMNAILKPGEQVDFPSVIGAKSVGYFVDAQYSREQDGDPIYIEGSDGSESKPTYGGEWSRTNGTIQATYKVTNLGNKIRRILVYTTQPAQ